MRLETKWLSPRTDDGCIPPMNLEMFEREIKQFLLENKNGMIILNGLDVLEKWNGWRPVLEVLRRMEQAVEECNGNLIISLDPKCHFPVSRSILEPLRRRFVIWASPRCLGYSQEKYTRRPEPSKARPYAR